MEYPFVQVTRHSLPQFPSHIAEAAFNPDLWTSVFHLLLLHAGENPAELTLYRQRAGEAKKAITVQVQQGTHDLPPEVEMISFHGAVPGHPTIDFRLDNDLYSIHAACTEADLLRQKILEVKNEIIHSIKVNRALLSPETCFGGTVLCRLQDPAFGLTLDGVITWQNEAAAAESWQQAYSGGLGKPLRLPQDCDQAGLRSALSDLSGALETSVRIFPIAVHGQPRSAIMALKAVQLSYPFTSSWVELFKPAPQAIAVIRSWDSKPNISPSSLRQLYGLTAKEAELAVGLAQGESLRDFANRTGVSVETARWHSKSVMQKMDCSKQQDLMYALLYRNALFSILD